MTVIDAYLTSISSVPEGGKRSPLVTAMLREVLHGNDGSYLLVDTVTGRVVVGGTESATCAIRCKIGDDFRLDPSSG